MTSGQTDQHNDPDNTSPGQGGATQDQEGNGSQSTPAPQKSAAEQEKEDLANLGKLMLDIADIIDDQETSAAAEASVGGVKTAPIPATAVDTATAFQAAAGTEIDTSTTPSAPAPAVEPSSWAPQQLLDTSDSAAPPKPTSSQTKLNPFFALSEAAAKRTQEQALLKLQQEAEQAPAKQATPDEQPAAIQPALALPVESGLPPQPMPQAAEPAVQAAEPAVQAAEPIPQFTSLPHPPEAIPQAAEISKWAAPAPTAPNAQSPANAPSMVSAPIISAPPKWALDAAAAAPSVPEPEPTPAPPPSDAASPPILSAVVSKRELSQSAQLQSPESQAPPAATEWAPPLETTLPPLESQLQDMPIGESQPIAQTSSEEPPYDPYKPYQAAAYGPQPAYDPQPAYEPQPAYAQPDYEPQPAYDPQQQYDPLQQPYTPQQTEKPLEQAYAPLQQAYEPQQGFATQQQPYYDPQQQTYDTQPHSEPHYEPQAEPDNSQTQQEQPAAPETEEPVDLRTLFSKDADSVSSSLPKARDLSHQSTSRSLIRRRTNEAQAPQEPSKPAPAEARSDSSTEAVDLRNLFSEDVAPSVPSPSPSPAPAPPPPPPAPPAPSNQPASASLSSQITPEIIQAQEQRLSAIKKTLETSAEFGALADDEFKVTHTPEQLQNIAQETKKSKPRKTFLGLPSWGAHNSLTANDPGAQNQQPPQQKARKTFFGLPTFGSNEAVNEQPKPPSEPGAKPRKTFLGIPAIPLVENLFNRDAPPAEPPPQQQTFEPEFIDTPSDPNRQTVFDRAAQTAAEYQEQEPGADDLSEWIKSAHYAFERGQFEVAERYYLRVLGIMETRADLEESLVVTCMKNLGDVYFFLGKTEDAVDVFEQLASTLEKTPDETYLNVVVDLARAYGTVGKLTQGSELCMRAMQLAGDILPPGHELHGRLNNAYVGIIRRKSGDARSVDLTGAPNKRQTQERTGIGLRGKVAVRLEPIEDETRIRSDELMKSKDFLAALNTVGITVLVCGIILGTTQKFFSTIAATEQAKASAEYTGREYKTVDGLKSLRFDKDNVCYYWHEGKLVPAKYFAVGGSWMEAVRLLAGCQRVKDIWYQAKGDRIIDSDGSTLYLGTAPENDVVKKMWWYSGFADWHMKEHKSYPTDEQKWKDVAPNFYYTNPFNGKPDLPTFIQAKGAASPNTPQITASGAAWPRQPAARPGAITALCLDYVRFFIRGYDRDGVLLTSSKPGRYFYLELRDGQNITQDELLKFKDKAEQTQDPTPVRVYMTQDAGVASVLSFMKIGIPGGLWLLWLLSLGQSFVVVRLCDTTAKRLLAFAGVLVPTILLFMWYVIALSWV